MMGALVGRQPSYSLLLDHSYYGSYLTISKLGKQGFFFWGESRDNNIFPRLHPAPRSSFLHVMKMCRVDFCCVVNIMNCLAGCFLWKHKQNRDIPAVLDVEKIFNLVSQMVSSYVVFVCSNNTSNTVSLKCAVDQIFFHVAC